MCFGKWRGVMLALTLTLLGGFSARGAGFGHVIPHEVPAMDYRTGGQAYAPPIPYGEYTKDYLGCLTAPVHGLLGRFCMLCGKLGCGACGGSGLHNGGLCGSCGGDGCGHCDGDSGFGHGHGNGITIGHGREVCGACGGAGCAQCGGGQGLIHRAGLHHGAGGHGATVVETGHQTGGSLLHHEKPLCGPGQSCATPQGTTAVARPSGQGIAGTLCGSCGGKGCGHCGGRGILGGLGHGQSVCGSCGGKGCGSCGGRGLFDGLGHGQDVCGNCGGKGCGHCGGRGLFGHGKEVCGYCGGEGCDACKKHWLKGKHLGLPLPGFLHGGHVKYFVGPGGPVPITPGYVPYVNPVRSPRDFFAFPPYIDHVLY